MVFFYCLDQAVSILCPSCKPQHLTIGVSVLSINLQTIYKVISQKDNAKQMSITKSQFQ